MSGSHVMNGRNVHMVSWQDFLRVTKKYGFKCGYCDIFYGHGVKNPYRIQRVIEEEVVLYNPSNGLIIYAQTFNGRKKGAAVVYGQFQGYPRRMGSKQQRFFETHVAMMRKGIDGLGFEMKIPSDFEGFISELFENFKFFPIWNVDLRPSFLNYMQRENREIDRKKENDEKISGFSEDVLMIMNSTNT